MKKRILIYASDHNYFKYTRASLASFARLNSYSDWTVIFANIGLMSWQEAELAAFGKVVKHKPCQVKGHHDIIFPAARAKLQILHEYASDDTILLFVDSDTLMFDNLDGLISRFEETGALMAIGTEEVDEFWRTPAHYGWRNGEIPDVFDNQQRWRNAPIHNTGVFLAQGAIASRIGEIAVNIYDAYINRVMFGEQTIISSLLYDRELAHMALPIQYNCFVWEDHITHDGHGPKYVATRPFFRGESVVIRHFCGPGCKKCLDEAILLFERIPGNTC